MKRKCYRCLQNVQFKMMLWFARGAWVAFVGWLVTGFSARWGIAAILLLLIAHDVEHDRAREEPEE